MDDHKRYIDLAVERAKQSVDKGGYPFGAIIVKDNTIVGESNIENQAFDPTAHAELSSIRDACKNLKASDLTGCRIYSSCHPCQMCLGAIKWVGIKEIYYGMDKTDAEHIGYSDDIFLDDTINLTRHKIKNENIINFMEIWYGQRI